MNHDTEIPYRFGSVLQSHCQRIFQLYLSLATSMISEHTTVAGNVCYIVGLLYYHVCHSIFYMHCV
jgi:hypothetical protein